MNRSILFASPLLLLFAFAVDPGDRTGGTGPAPGSWGTSSDPGRAALLEPAQRERADAATGALPVGAAPLEESLATYWGPRWPGVRAALLESGIDLGTEVAIAPWEQVAPLAKAELTALPEDQRVAIIQNHLRYPEALTLEWMKSHYGVPGSFAPEDLGYVEEIALPFNEEARGLASQYVEHLGYALEDLWASERYMKAPVSSAGAPSPYTGRRFYSASTGVGMWAVTLSVERGAFPYLDMLRDRIEQLREARDDRIREHLARTY